MITHFGEQSFLFGEVFSNELVGLIEANNNMHDPCIEMKKKIVEKSEIKQMVRSGLLEKEITLTVFKKEDEESILNSIDQFFQDPSVQ